MNAAVMMVSKTRPVSIRMKRKRKRMKEEGRKREDGQLPSDGRLMDGWVGDDEDKVEMCSHWQHIATVRII